MYTYTYTAARLICEVSWPTDDANNSFLKVFLEVPSVNLYPYNFLLFILPLRPYSEHYLDFHYLSLLFGQLCRLRGRKNI